jgi:hypothetical protein
LFGDKKTLKERAIKPQMVKGRKYYREELDRTEKAPKLKRQNAVSNIILSKEDFNMQMLDHVPEKWDDEM